MPVCMTKISVLLFTFASCVGFTGLWESKLLLLYIYFMGFFFPDSSLLQFCKHADSSRLAQILVMGELEGSRASAAGVAAGSSTAQTRCKQDCFRFFFPVVGVIIVGIDQSSHQSRQGRPGHYCYINPLVLFGG